MHYDKLVTVSREWKSPEIKKTFSLKWEKPEIGIDVTSQYISISMSADDFKKALVHELGGLVFTITKRGLLKKIDRACEAIFDGMKKETSKVV